MFRSELGSICKYFYARYYLPNFIVCLSLCQTIPIGSCKPIVLSWEGLRQRELLIRITLGIVLSATEREKRYNETPEQSSDKKKLFEKSPHHRRFYCRFLRRYSKLFFFAPQGGGGDTEEWNLRSIRRVQSEICERERERKKTECV